MKGKVNKKFRILHNEELGDFYRLPIFGWDNEILEDIMGWECG
jgi:hypothetical protein